MDPQTQPQNNNTPQQPNQPPQNGYPYQQPYGQPQNGYPYQQQPYQQPQNGYPYQQQPYQQPQNGYPYQQQPYGQPQNGYPYQQQPYGQPQNGYPYQQPYQQPYFPPAQPPKQGAGRVANFFFSLLPMLSFFAIQIFATFVMIFLMIFIALCRTDGNMQAVMQDYESIVYRSVPTATALSHLLAAIVFAFWYRFSFRKPRPAMRETTQKLKPEPILMALGLGILMSVFSSGTSGIESLLFPQMVEDTYEMMERSGIGTNGLVIFATVCLAPIGEELVFRGLTMKYAEKAFGAVLGSQSAASVSVRRDTHELGTGRVCILRRTGAGLGRSPLSLSGILHADALCRQQLFHVRRGLSPRLDPAELYHRYPAGGNSCGNCNRSDCMAK